MASLWRARCFHCEAKFARRDFVFARGEIRCRACGAVQISKIPRLVAALLIVFLIPLYGLLLIVCIELGAGLIKVLGRHWSIDALEVILGVMSPFAIMGLLGYGLEPYVTWFEPVQPNAVCRRCGYDLRASKNSCPECGEAIPTHPTAALAERSASPEERP